MKSFSVCALPGGQTKFKALDLLLHARAHKWNLLNHALVDKCIYQFNTGKSTIQSTALMQALDNVGGVILTGTFFARASHGHSFGAKFSPTYSTEALPPVFHVPQIFQKERNILLAADAFFDNGDPRVLVEVKDGRYNVSFTSLQGVEAVPVDFGLRRAQPCGPHRLPFGKPVNAAESTPNPVYVSPYYISNIFDFGLILRAASSVKGRSLHWETIYLESRPSLLRLIVNDNTWPALQLLP